VQRIAGKSEAACLCVDHDDLGCHARGPDGCTSRVIAAGRAADGCGSNCRDTGALERTAACVERIHYEARCDLLLVEEALHEACHDHRVFLLKEGDALPARQARPERLERQRTAAAAAAAAGR
jgi:hypothetical protein